MINIEKIITCIILVSLVTLDSYGQKLFIINIDSKQDIPSDFQSLNNQTLDSAAIKPAIYYQIEQAKSDGFLLANLDELSYQNDTVFASIYLGEKHEHILLLESDSFTKMQIKSRAKKTKSGRLFEYSDLKKYLTKVHYYYQNHGYPFVSVRLDSLKYKDSVLSTRVYLDEGPEITYDSLNIGSFEAIKLRFLSNFLDINVGENYNNSDVDDITYKIDELPYLRLTSPPQVNFRLGKAEVAVDLESVPVNSFDGILGFVPSQNEAGSQLTGELRLAFDNLFKSGKKINFEWQKLNQKSQFLDATYYHPKLFYSPLNFSFNYNQLKEDTIFSNRTFVIGFDYQISKHVNIFTDYSNKNGNNINANDNQLGDFDINNYSFGLDWKKLDNVWTPKNGFRTKIKLSIGSKTVISSLLNSIKNFKSNQYELLGEFGYYKQITKRSVFHANLRTGYIDNDQLFLNDLFRIGGLSTLRGFNEKAFFASKYGLVNLEWQLLMSEGSYFLAFFDQAILRYDLENSTFEENPTGIGVGLKVKTRAGFFNLIYGLGKTSNQNFSFNFSKLHFGYVATL